MTMLRLNALQQTSLNSTPYPYLVLEQCLDDQALDAVMKDFPDIHHPGSIPTSEVEGGKAFQALVQELEGEAFQRTIAEKFSVDLSGLPTMTTVRGVMRQKDGRIHTDSKTKVITVLLYFNQDWSDQGGHLRILRNGGDIEDYVEEIPPAAGTLIAFKVTDNCWHGHKPVVGKRLSIQMNYLIGNAAKGKHQFFHRLSAKLKKCFKNKSS